MIHPLVRDLYKRVLIVGKDYPNYTFAQVKHIWKQEIRNPTHCPSWYHHHDDDHQSDQTMNDDNDDPDEYLNMTDNDYIRLNQIHNNTNRIENDMEELYKAVHRGRYMVKEMIGIIQLHKYRSMKQRYDDK